MTRGIPQARQTAARDRGAIAVVVAVASVMLLIAAALAFDLGRAYVSRAAQQNAADAAALAAARDLASSNTAPAVTTALDVARSRYGYILSTDVVTAVPDVTRPRDLRITVTITRPITFAFGVFVGRNDPLNITVSATANKIVAVPFGYAAYTDGDLTLKGGSSITGSIYANHLIAKGTSDVSVGAPVGQQAFIDVRNGVTACTKADQVIGNARTMLTSGAGVMTDSCVSGTVYWSGTPAPNAFPTWTGPQNYASSIALLSGLITNSDSALARTPVLAEGTIMPTESWGVTLYACSFPSKNPGTYSNVQFIVCRNPDGTPGRLTMDGTNLGWFNQSVLKAIVAGDFKSSAPAGTYGVKPADGYHPVLIYLKGTDAQFQMTGTGQINGYLYVPNGSVSISASPNEKDATDATSNLSVNGRIITRGSIKYSGQASTIPDALIDQETAADPNPQGFTLHLIK